GRFTRDIAGPAHNYKMQDTAQRLSYRASKSAAKRREFIALQLDFADVNFLTDVRRALNVSNMGSSTRWMGFGQRLSFELYESLLRTPGEVLVRVADVDRELSQRMCPKTYGGGLCQMSLLHEGLANLVRATTGVPHYNKLCRVPLPQV